MSSTIFPHINYILAERARDEGGRIGGNIQKGHVYPEEWNPPKLHDR